MCARYSNVAYNVKYSKSSAKPDAFLVRAASQNHNEALTWHPKTNSGSGKCAKTASTAEQEDANDASASSNDVISRAASSLLAAAVILSSSLGCGPELMPASASQFRLTPEEQNNIKIFKTAKPSVVNVTNLTSR